jgi:tyrosinase
MIKIPRLAKRSSLLVWLAITLFTIAIIVLTTELQHRSPSYRPPSIDAPTPALVYPPATVAPTQIRKSVVNLTTAEKTAFVNAIDTLKTTTTEGSQLSIYDQLVLQHAMTMGFRKRLGATGPAQGNPAHGHPAFLPWHRQFLYEFEQELQKIDPTVTVRTIAVRLSVVEWNVPLQFQSMQRCLPRQLERIHWHSIVSTPSLILHSFDCDA